MPETMVEFLREKARAFGPRPALLFKPGLRYQRWTYAQTWEESGRVASLITQRGLKKGDRVLLWAPNCPQWVFAFFGCMQAGVIAVPLDLRSSEEFVDRVTSKTRPVLAFVSRFTPPAYQRLKLPKIHLEELEDLARDLPPMQGAEVLSGDVAEILFTSGTTGDPKGVMLTHANLISNLEAAAQCLPGKPSYRLLSVLPLSHMLEQMGTLFMALNCGASVTFVTSRQPTVLLKTMRERKVSTILLVPQALELLMNGIEREVTRQGKERSWAVLMRLARHSPFRLRRLLFRRVHKQFGGCLEFMGSGGAALDPELGAKWELLGIKVLQGYGTTEASPVISTNTLTDRRLDSVGRPLPGVTVKISNEGEVLVSGPNIMAGYWEAPEQTDAAFEGPWYKTGDLGFIDKQGRLHLKGRKKDMIVLSNGQNVFPEDIEAVLRKHPLVADAAVLGLSKGSGVEVHSAILLEDSENASQIVSWANQRLADHQQIRGFTVWPEKDFPRTHTLKVKKRAVLEVLMGHTTVTGPAQASKSAAGDGVPVLHHLVAELGRVPLEQVLPEKALGTDLNLDSLGRVELLSAIEEEFGVYLDETQVGPATTLSELTEMVGRGDHASGDSTCPRWGMRFWCRMLRGGIQRSFIFPPLFLLYRVQSKGMENLHGLQRPVLFAANHALHLDNGLMLKAFPPMWRRKLAIAASDHMWRYPFLGTAITLFGNGFPFSREGNVRASLESLGKILDDGWSVLIYPEGRLTVGGPMKPFMSGTGLLAVEARVPVVPIHLVIHRMGYPSGFPVMRRGDVEIRFGKPLTFSPGTSYADATSAIEEAVKAL